MRQEAHFREHRFSKDSGGYSVLAVLRTEWGKA
uniref:Uncharacterized protein n=1 Tax=Vibrio vulnificus TaxID=672 RepID=A0A6S4PZW5_VIBVL|nr:hypothetical protein [Vibrio vulnificus]